MLHYAALQQVGRRAAEQLRPSSFSSFHQRADRHGVACGYPKLLRSRSRTMQVSYHVLRDVQGSWRYRLLRWLTCRNGSPHHRTDCKWWVGSGSLVCRRDPSVPCHLQCYNDARQGAVVSLIASRLGTKYTLFLLVWQHTVILHLMPTHQNNPFDFAPLLHPHHRFSSRPSPAANRPSTLSPRTRFWPSSRPSKRRRESRSSRSVSSTLASSCE
jgi:hypothetical protein